MARPRRTRYGITGLFVHGFKSLMDPTDLAIRPLTVLAGANSSGKSSILQPLLLLKQTLEASYDPGPLRIDGPNVEFTAVEQFLSRIGVRKDKLAPRLKIGLEVNDEVLELTFQRRQKGRPLELVEMSGRADEGGGYSLRPGWSGAELRDHMPPSWQEFFPGGELSIRRNRCFFEISLGP